jgi:acetylornithine/succinyldiaminopimelate/putrescine aminotransferase
MTALRRLCDEQKLTLICDEVWTAPARTGKWFAYQHYGITPDILTIGKATGGGAPVAAMIARPHLAEQLGPGKHGCTLGGNPLCAAAGVATMKLIEDEHLVEAAVRKGERIMAALRAAHISKVKDVRGKGMMIGIALDRPGKDIFSTCLKRGLLINCTQDTVLRLAPPLVVEEALIDQGLDLLIDVIRKA